MKYKYQNELDYYIQQGALIPALHDPKVKEAYRYVFANEPQKNHLPPHKLHPNRLLQQIKNGNVDLSGFALSNLETKKEASAFYRYLCKICKNAKKQIGDSMSYGIINSGDGMITSTDSYGHFDLYESDSCDLASSFKIIQAL